MEKEIEFDCSDVRLISIDPHQVYCYINKDHRHFASNGAIMFDEECDCKEKKKKKTFNPLISK